MNKAEQTMLALQLESADIRRLISKTTHGKNRRSSLHGPCADVGKMSMSELTQMLDDVENERKTIAFKSWFPFIFVPPEAPVLDFWRAFGPRGLMGLFAIRTHPDWKDRVATMDREIRRIEALTEPLVVPPVLSARDRPLDGDWEAILVRHR